MRLIAIVVILTWAIPAWADIAVRADDIPAEVPVIRPTAVSSTVEILPFMVSGTAVPAWLGRSLQRSVGEELQAVPGIEVLAKSAATQSTRRADYSVRGRCVGSPVSLAVTFDVVHANSQALVFSATIKGEPTEILQIKEALRDQVRNVFSPASPKPQAGAPSNAGPTAVHTPADGR